MIMEGLEDFRQLVASDVFFYQSGRFKQTFLTKSKHDGNNKPVPSISLQFAAVTTTTIKYMPPISHEKFCIWCTDN